MAARRRRDPEAARAAILDVAEGELARVGPAGIRLQEVATLAGVTHPNVIHHFGSREGLIRAVVQRAFESMEADLYAALCDFDGATPSMTALMEIVYTALDRDGHARVLMWLALGGHQEPAPTPRLARVVEATHALRGLELRGKAAEAARQETARAVAVAALTLVGATVLGDSLLRDVGLPVDDAQRRQLRGFVMELMLTHLMRRGS